MKEKVIKIIEDVYAKPLEKPIDSETDLIGDLGFSSLEMLILISEIESQFNIILTPERFSGKVTVEDVCGVIKERVSVE